MAPLSLGSDVCPICRAPSPVLAFVKNGYPLHRCTTCEVVLSARPPRGEKLEALYSSEYFTSGGAGYPNYLADERTHRRQARVYLRKIRRLGISPGSVLDVGCAAGFFLDEARKQGWAVKGCEVSEYAQQHAEHELGLDVTRSSFLDPNFTPPSGSFDVVTLFNVLEHLPDPAKVESRLFDVVSPGGYLVLETWDPQSLFARLLGSRWPTYAPPTVLYCFTRRALGRLFARGRWSPVSYRPSTKWISAGHGLSLLEYEMSQTSLAPVLRALRRSWMGRVDLPYFFGDLTLAVFRRTSALALKPSHSEPPEPRVNVIPAWPCLPV